MNVWIRAAVALGVGILSLSVLPAHAEIITRQIGQVTLETNTVTNQTTGSIPGGAVKFRLDNRTGVMYVLENDVVISQHDVQIANLQVANNNPYGAEVLRYYQQRHSGLSIPKRSWSTSMFNPTQCAFGECDPTGLPQPNPYYAPPFYTTPGFNLYDDQVGDGPGPSGEMIELDQWLFGRWREERCDDAYGWINNTLFVAAGVGTVASCLSAATGAGLALCVTAYAAMIAMAEAQADAERDCQSQWTGYREWG